MSIGEISLEGRGLDGINRQNRKQDRMSAKRFLIRPHNAAAGFRDCLCSLGRSSCGLIEPAFCWAQTLRSGFGFARAPPGWCTFDHGRDSILVPDGLSLVADHGHNDSALARPRMAHFEMKHLLPGTATPNGPGLERRYASVPHKGTVRTRASTLIFQDRFSANFQK